jgi:uncharacterized protein
LEGIVPKTLSTLLVTALSLGSALALDVPPLTGRIVDLAHLLPSDVATSLSQELAAHEQRTGNQVAVLTLPTLQGDSLEEFSHRVATTWKLGQKGTDNGVLLLVVPEDRHVRIEVGYGLEGTLTDAMASRIIRNEIIPHFRRGEYAQGVSSGVRAILGTIEGTYTPPEMGPAAGPQDNGLGTTFLVASAVGILIGIFLGRFRKGLGAVSGAVVGFLTGLSAGWLIALGAGVMALLAVLVLLSRSLTGSRASPFGGGWGGAPGGMGDFSGTGSFGGGGGNFGGGGASGRW